MAAKQQDKQSKPAATTYLGHRKDGVWQVWRVTMAEDGSLSKERVLEHPTRVVARERLRVLLDSAEVLP